MQGQLFLIEYWNQWNSGVFVILSYVAACLFYREEDAAASFLSIFCFYYIKWYQSRLYLDQRPACAMIATSLTTSLVRDRHFRKPNWWSSNVRASSWYMNSRMLSLDWQGNPFSFTLTTVKVVFDLFITIILNLWIGSLPTQINWVTVGMMIRWLGESWVVDSTSTTIRVRQSSSTNQQRLQPSHSTNGHTSKQRVWQQQ